MNKRHIIRPHSPIIICLALVSMLLLLATPFITSVDPSCIFVEEDIVKWLLNGLVAAMLICALVNTLRAIAAVFMIWKEIIVHKMKVVVMIGLGGNAAYYAFCMYLILKAHEWDVMSILAGDVVISTQAYIPLLLQILLACAASAIDRHWSGGLSSASVTQTDEKTEIGEHATHAEHPVQATYSSSQSLQNEMEHLELLKKYKELLDNQIITEDEFYAKKRELLTRNYADTSAVMPASRTQQPPPVHRAENELSGVCRNCGYPLTSTQQVCPHCGMKTAEKLASEQHRPMKWYNFLVYFALFAGAVVHVITAFWFFTGAVYGDSAHLVYQSYAMLRNVDMLVGFLSIGLVIMALCTRSALYWNKKKGPTLLCVFYLIPAIMSVLYAVALTLIVDAWISELLYLLIYLGVDIVFVILNHIYFKKRRDVFKY